MTFQKILFLIIGVLITSYCNAEVPLPNSSVDTLNLVGKQWKLGFKDENTKSKIAEYTTNQENVNNWTELVTFQRFKFDFPKEVTAITFADKEITDLKAKEYKYTYTVHESSPQEAIIEFRVTSPADLQQDELQRIIKTSTNELIVLNYAVKKPDMGEAERTNWIKSLKEIESSLLP